jgi:hypothetical protein
MNESPTIAPPESGELGTQIASWRQSKWLAIGELLVVALIFLADEGHLIPFSKTPFLLAHGIQDSIDFVLIFLAKYPGM